MNANSNITTASKLIRRAQQIADVANSDFLNYEELTEYLNASWKNVYQTIIQYNLNVFTVEANLFGSSGVYKLPFDCYQIKSIKILLQVLKFQEKQIVLQCMVHIMKL